MANMPPEALEAREILPGERAFDYDQRQVYFCLAMIRFLILL
jgi:hypothetical protein